MGRLFALVGAGLLAPAMALADNGTMDAFAIDLPSFNWEDIGFAAGSLLAVVAAITVYRNVKWIISRG